MCNRFIENDLLAEATRFERVVPLRVRQFSKLLVSATHPHFHGSSEIYLLKRQCKSTKSFAFFKSILRNFFRISRQGLIMLKRKWFAKIWVVS